MSLPPTGPSRTPTPGVARGSDGRTRAIVRLVLAAFLMAAGVAHFAATETFLAQVPPWMPTPVAVVLVSGVIEVVLGLALALAPARRRPTMGWVVAAFFVLVFPGNLSQFVTGTDAFGLDTDLARGIRLLFQPVLVVVALWCTGAWSAWRSGRRR